MADMPMPVVDNDDDQNRNEKGGGKSNLRVGKPQKISDGKYLIPINTLKKGKGISIDLLVVTKGVATPKKTGEKNQNNGEITGYMGLELEPEDDFQEYTIMIPTTGDTAELGLKGKKPTLPAGATTNNWYALFVWIGVVMLFVFSISVLISPIFGGSSSGVVDGDGHPYTGHYAYGIAARKAVAEERPGFGAPIAMFLLSFASVIGAAIYTKHALKEEIALFERKAKLKIAEKKFEAKTSGSGEGGKKPDEAPASIWGKIFGSYWTKMGVLEYIIERIVGK
jgi:hypothetical protein